MNKLNQSQFADKYDVSRQNIHSRIREGNLILGRDKLIDQTNPINKKWIDDAPSREKKSKEQKQDPSDRHDENELKKELSRQRIKKLDLEYKIKRREYVPIELVARIFAKLHTIDQTGFLNLSHSLSPKIMSACGIVDDSKEIELQAIIEKEIWKSLDNQKRQLDDFMKDIEVDDD